MKKLNLLTLVLSFLFVFPAFAVNVGDKAPDVTLENVLFDNATIAQSILQREAGQKFTLIDFSSIYCGPCTKNLPNLKKIADDMAATTTVRIINVDKNKQASVDFLNKHRDTITFPFALDINRQASAAYGIKYTPTMYIIDQEGKIIYTHIGTLNAQQVTEIEKILE